MFDLFKKYFSPPTEPPEFWKGYALLFERKKKKDELLKACRVVVFDTETTGFDIKKDKICQIGAVAVLNNRILLGDFFNTILIQESGGSKTEKEVHGLRDSDLQAGQDERKTLEEFIAYIGDAVLVAHHAPFDVGMINQALKRHFGASCKLKNEVLDTVDLEYRLRGRSAFAPQNPKEFTLDALAEKYQVDLHDRHTAIGDAFITASIFLKIKAQLEAKGNHTVKNFLRT